MSKQPCLSPPCLSYHAVFWNHEPKQILLALSSFSVDRQLASIVCLVPSLKIKLKTRPQILCPSHWLPLPSVHQPTLTARLLSEPWILNQFFPRVGSDFSERRMIVLDSKPSLNPLLTVLLLQAPFSSYRKDCLAHPIPLQHVESQPPLPEAQCLMRWTKTGWLGKNGWRQVIVKTPTIGKKCDNCVLSMNTSFLYFHAETTPAP